MKPSTGAPSPNDPFTTALVRYWRAVHAETDHPRAAPATHAGNPTDGAARYGRCPRGAFGHHSSPAPTTFFNASPIASGAHMMEKKLLLPIILKSGKLSAIRNLACNAYTCLPDTSSS